MIDTNRLTSNKWFRYGFISFIAWIFIAFVAGWLFLIPVIAVAFLVYGYVVYARERKHRIEVQLKPTEAMKALARREEELRREKEKLVTEEFGKKTKR